MPKPDHWGCAFNEERSPFSTRKSQCDGEVTFKDGPRIWVCEAHDLLVGEHDAPLDRVRAGES